LRDVKESWHVANELSFSQCLLAIAQLATHETMKEIISLAGVEHKVITYLRDLRIELNDSHCEILPAILWSLTVLNWEIPEDFLSEAIDII
jgi:hypothetical protein